MRRRNLASKLDLSSRTMADLHLPIEARLATDELTVFGQFQQILDLRDCNILEIGGHLDSEVVRASGVSNWWSLDPRHYPSSSRCVAQRIQGRVEATPLPDNSVDHVFSCNAFQHIQDVRRGLSELLRVLRAGGCLYANFGPVWSGPDGSHIEALVVEDRRYDFWEQALLPAWSHLVFDEEELTALLSPVYERTLATAISRYVFHSTWINRLFYDDLKRIIGESAFEIVFMGGCKLLDYDCLPPDIENPLMERLHPERLEAEIKKRHGSDMDDFLSRDIELILRKRP